YDDINKSFTFTPPYFQASFIAIDTKYAQELYKNWLDCYKKIDQKRLMEECSYYTEQIALAVAVTKMKIPFEILQENDFPEFIHYINTDKIKQNKEWRSLIESLLDEHKGILEIAKNIDEWKLLLGSSKIKPHETEGYKELILKAILDDDIKRAKSLISSSNKLHLDRLNELLHRSNDRYLPLKDYKKPFPKSAYLFISDKKISMSSSFFYQNVENKFGLISIKKELKKVQSFLKDIELVSIFLETPLIKSNFSFDIFNVDENIIVDLTASIDAFNSIKEQLKKIKFNSVSLLMSNDHFDETTDIVRKCQTVLNDFNVLEKNSGLRCTTKKVSIYLDKDIINKLEAIFEASLRNNIQEINLLPAGFFKTENYQKSIFFDFDENYRKINKIIADWNKKGLKVTFYQRNKKLKKEQTCHLINKSTYFNNQPKPSACPGKITYPGDNGKVSNKASWNSFPMRYIRFLHSSKKTDLPYVCMNCSLINLKNYSLSFVKEITINRSNVIVDTYNKASMFKLGGNFREAEKNYYQLLDENIEPKFRGNIYFHLGEISLYKKNTKNALNNFKQAVHYNIDHKFAFAYIRLLMKENINSMKT
ncbi:MAG: hypothetical protein HQK84_11820, partial [Nitrospinae bacterium]|nr:hypothetical protein [Nitrospinota bacterium]